MSGKHFLYAKDHGYKPLIDKRLGNASPHFVGIFLKKCVFVGALGLCCSSWASPGVVSGAPLWCTRGLCIAVASLMKHRRWARGLRSVAPAFSSPGHVDSSRTRGQAHVFCVGRRTPTLGQQGSPLRGLLEVQVASRLREVSLCSLPFLPLSCGVSGSPLPDPWLGR